MKADRTYARVTFAPATECALGPVTIYGPDGVTKLGVISVAKLRARDAANEKMAEAALKLLEGPEPRRRGPAMTFKNGRKRKQPAA